MTLRTDLEASLELETLRAEVKRLREALKPFSEAADCLDNPDPDRMEIWEHGAAMCITAGDLRRAREALSAKP